MNKGTNIFLHSGTAALGVLLAVSAGAFMPVDESTVNREPADEPASRQGKRAKAREEVKGFEGRHKSKLRERNRDRLDKRRGFKRIPA